MVHEAVNAAEALSEEGVNCTVVDMHTIKPLDSNLLEKIAKTCGCVVTAEDHSIIGGLGSSISEWAASNRPMPIEMVGVNDRFGESGDSSELMMGLGLTAESIVEASRRAIRRKKGV